MSLEELLEVQLRGMSITGIHHTHEKGEWMVGYRFSYMNMEGNRVGTERVSVDDVFADGFMVAPTKMSMQMHMLGVMYAPTDWVTVMLMAPYVRKSMDHVTMAGGAFTTTSRGIGDLMLTGLFRLYESASQELVFEFGVSFPSGSIDEVDLLPTGLARLPYPMQLGSGTWDFPLALAYIGQRPSWLWGARVAGLLRSGENDNQYRLGHRYEATAWLARLITEWLSASLRLDFQGNGNIKGADPTLNPMIVPTADPNLRAIRRLDILFGINLFANSGKLDGNNLTFEAGLPVYQWLAGPQLETDWRLSLAWQYTF
jgi:hypothetical protein